MTPIDHDHNGEECERCDLEMKAEVRHYVLAQRGRWLVVDDVGNAYRYARLSMARRHVRLLRHIGMVGRLMRYHRAKVEYSDGGLVVTRRRWMP